MSTSQKKDHAVEGTKQSERNRTVTLNWTTVGSHDRTKIEVVKQDKKQKQKKKRMRFVIGRVVQILKNGTRT